MFLCRNYSVSFSEGGGYDAVGVDVVQVVGETVRIVRSYDPITAATLASQITLDFRSDKERLSFTGQITLVDALGSASAIQLTVLEVPGLQVANGSRVGLMTRYASGQFLRLEVDEPDQVTTLVPEGGPSRVLTHLTLKRNFIRPIVSGGSTGYAPPRTKAALADFAQWFWLVPPLYSYGQIYAGIGGELI
jgi:hypothetical protein